ncbi:MAG: HAMP domain-containing histidine kinase [Cyclobacteriaceae bacterium]|nr:HAMP domain-containing histidine kinase [Cyclobacteriaceae bacterium]
MYVYHSLSRISKLSKYSYKFLFIAFLGIHIPLIGIIIYSLLGNHVELTQGQIIFWILIFTLIATGITLYLLNQLLAPLILSKEALENYIESRKLPSLPSGYKDEAGVLMQKVQNTLVTMDELVQAKNDMIELISHDLRSPINRNLGLIALAISENQESEIDEYLKMIEKESKKQINLLGHLLKQLEREEIEIGEDQKEIVLLKNLIIQKLETLADIIKQKRLQVNINISDQLKIKVDKELFGQVLQNLIHNASKFSNSEQIIEISAEQEPNHLKIKVRDFGIGFSTENSERLFRRFTDMGRLGTQGEESTGIGLYLSRRIIERHSGSLRGFSDGKNKGATFEIIIPN